MSNTETVFNPVDESLESQIRAYYDLCVAYTHAHASLKHTRQNGTVDYIGDLADIEDACRITSKSLHEAQQVISNESLLSAKQKNLITNEQYSEIVLAQRTLQMSSRRAQAGDVDSKSDYLSR